MSAKVKRRDLITLVAGQIGPGPQQASRRTRMERVSNLLIEHCERNVRESDKNSDVLRAAA